MPARLALALLLPALIAAGCGGQKESPGSGTAGGSVKEPASATGGRVVRVAMRDILFVPDKITARVGQTVRWRNQDDVKHTVVAKKGADFASKPLSKGDAYEVKMTKTGRIGYVCTIHPSQRGTITVVRK